MEPIILKGKALADEIKAGVASDVAKLVASGIKPKVAVILATKDESAISYADAKSKAARALGISFELIKADSQTDLENAINTVANDPLTHGILLELPVAVGLDASRALDLIPPSKDIDGLTLSNCGAISSGRDRGSIAAATPLACIRLVESFTTLQGKRVAVVGRGKTVGRPLVGLLLNRDATPTVCHTKTLNLAEVTRSCEILIVAAGRPNLIGSDHLREGHIVIDAGINFVNGKLVGDVDYEAALAAHVSAISPVPGGVGPVTSALIFSNLVSAIRLQMPSLI